MSYDIVILTDGNHLFPNENNPIVSNVVLEDQLVAEALREVGLSVTRKAWDDTEFNWSSAKYALFRTTWDYFNRFDEFFDWFQKTKKLTHFINSAELIQWNIDKHYLQNLNSKGVHIPRTLFVEKGSSLTLKDAVQKAKNELSFNTREFILKPCIAAGARHTYRFGLNEIDSYSEIFQQLIAKEAMMLQELQHNILAKGEMSLMLFNGEYSHAVLKVAKPGDFRVQDDYGGTVHDYEPSTEEITLAQKVVDSCAELPAYARVDIFKDNEGHWALAELEIFEPELWFRNKPEAAKVLANIIHERIVHEKIS